MMERGITAIIDWFRVADRFSTIDRYDLLLGLIPMAFAVAGLVGRLFGLPTEAALVGGVVIASLALLDGLVVRPPTKPPRDV
ncbi:hypothetical protein HYG81_07840 [Natrinema zhouii]|uniref:Uncharacterized protein n=1 Tax=Natrinema zhouii TaxID=1710539 RepID=A0A7D6GLW7_9EURY|nr:hypothetical protein [Natrinema zhouii]QLK27500.1 hypothetical protein HYG81_07840 [Natrinema zhouii]